MVGHLLLVTMLGPDRLVSLEVGSFLKLLVVKPAGLDFVAGANQGSFRTPKVSLAVLEAFCPSSTVMECVVDV